MERPAERTVDGGGVSNEQQPGRRRGHHSLDGLVDFLAHPLRFVDNDEHVGAVKPLKLVRRIGGQTNGVPVFGQFPSGVQHLPAEDVRGPAVQSADLPPEDVTHLPECRSRGQDYRRVVAMEEP